MTYLLTEIVLALLAAAALGFFAGWWFGQRSGDRDVAAESAAREPAPSGNAVRDSQGPG